MRQASFEITALCNLQSSAFACMKLATFEFQALGLSVGSCFLICHAPKKEEYGCNFKIGFEPDPCLSFATTDKLQGDPR